MKIKANIKPMNKTVLALAVSANVLLAGNAQASVELGEGFSVIGQFDGSFRASEKLNENGEEERVLQTGEFQLDFDYLHAASGLFAHVEFEGAGGNTLEDAGARIEAGFIGRQWDNGFTVKAGRIISPSGYEGAEAWDRHSRITAFGGIFAYLQNGVAVQYSKNIFSFYGSLIDGAWTGDTDFADPSFELQLGLDPFDSLKIRLGYAYEDYDNTAEATLANPNPVDQDRTIINLWAQYSVGNFVFATEYNRQDEMNVTSFNFDPNTGTGVANAWEGDAAFVFAKYNFTPKWSLGLRYSEAEYEDIDGNTVSDTSEVTITPRYQILADTTQWDIRADLRFQDGSEQFFNGIEDGFLFEIGTTLKF